MVSRRMRDIPRLRAEEEYGEEGRERESVAYL